MMAAYWDTEKCAEKLQTDYLFLRRLAMTASINKAANVVFHVIVLQEEEM